MTETRPSHRDAAHAEYRRQARRIRRVFAKQPESRMRALCALARDADARRVGANAPEPVVSLSAGAAQTFAELVRERMDGPVLRYSHRTRLIRDAERRGIARFEANLIIAAVQHQAASAQPQPVGVEQPRSAWTSAAFAFVATQSLIAIAVWWIIG